MKKILSLIAAIACGVVAEYVQTSPTGTAPWTPKRRVDSARIATIADSALRAPASAYADSSRASGLADSAKKAGWAPLDSGRVRGIVGDTATAMREAMGAYLPLAGGRMSGKLRLSAPYGTGIDFLQNHTNYGGVRLWHYGDASTYVGMKFSAIDTNGGSLTLPVWVIADVFAGYLHGSADSSTYASTAVNALSLGGVAAANYGTLTQDTLIAKKVVSDSLTANARAWTTLTAAKSSVHDTATVLRTYIGSASTTGNAATATKLATARTIAMTGDGTWSASFDGSANATGTLTLASLLTAGSAGSATTVPTLTWDPKGRLTATGSAAISIPHTQINDWGSYVSTTAIGALPYAGVSGSVDFNNIASKVAGAYPIFGITSYSNAPPGLAAAGGGGMLWQGFGANNLDWNAQIFVDAQQDVLWYRTEGSPATWRSWHQLLTSTSSIPHTQISDWSTATSSFLTTNQSISLTGAVTGSGTTSIATTFTNAHLAGINQDLTTTSSPTFGVASLGTWSASSSVAWFGAAGQNNNANGNSGFLQLVGGDKSVFMSAPVGGFVNLQYNSVGYLIVSASGVSIPASGLTVSGLITANGGITGNLTGHASLDIPLTGSSAITGALTSSNSSNIGSTSFNWGTVYATSVRSTGTTSISSFALSGDVLTLSHSNGDFTWVNTIRGSAGGLVLQNAIISGTFSPEVNLQSSTYIITRADQGKMVVSNNTLNLPSLTEHDAGFWCLVNWHVGGGTATFGPTTSGTTWILRGQYVHVSTSTPFTGIVSWDGYTWYAN